MTDSTRVQATGRLETTRPAARREGRYAEMKTVYRLLGAKVQHIRETLGLTQLELSKKIGLTRTSIANIEAGRQRVLLHDIETIAAAFGISPKGLLKGIWT